MKFDLKWDESASLPELEQALSEYLEALRSAPLRAALPAGLQGELPDALRALAGDVQEAYRLSLSLAEGNLRAQASSQNLLAGPLKDLQASLRHLTWQAKQVEKGDYQQQAAFLGEFSDAFNSMTAQLARRRDMVREQIERQARYYDAVEETHQEWRTLVHDVKNHLLAIDSLLDTGDLAAARTYISELRDKAERAGQELIHTGNRVLDSLLMDKLFVAKGAGVRVEQELALGRTLKMANVDCCTLFGNALDNALEGCWRMERARRQMVVRLKLTGNMLHADIENTSPPPAEQAGAGFATTKADKKRHGIGMKNIERVVAAYDGVWTAGFDHGWFRLRCLLCGV